MDIVGPKAAKDQRPGGQESERNSTIGAGGVEPLHRGDDDLTGTTTESRLITLNVGGEKMTTARATFAAAPAGSLLGLMFGPDADPLWTPPRLADGSYFLDLNPRHFAVVLDVLRHGPAMLHPLPDADRGAVALVADYLGLDLGATTCFATDVMRYRAMAAPDSARIMILAVTPSAFWSNRIELCDWNAKGIKAKYVPAMRSWTLAEVCGVLSSALDIPADGMIVQLCLRRRNGTVRPEARLPMDSTTVTLGVVHPFKGSALALLVHQGDFAANVGALPDAVLCQESTVGMPSAQTPAPAPARSPETVTQPPGSPMLVFAKCFDRTKKTLSKAMPLLVDAQDTIAVAVPAMSVLLGLSDDKHVHLFEEVSVYMVIEVDPTLTFADAGIAYGDILWLEPVDTGAGATAQLPVDSALIRHFGQLG